MKSYYVLLVLCPESKQWDLEFGDYSKSVVKEELDDYHHGSAQIPKKNMEILTIGSSDQSAIDKAVRDFNIEKNKSSINELMKIKMLKDRTDTEFNVRVFINVTVSQGEKEQDHTFSMPFHCPPEMLQEVDQGGAVLEYMGELVFAEYKRRKQFSFKKNNVRCSILNR